MQSEVIYGYSRYGTLIYRLSFLITTNKIIHRITFIGENLA